MRAWHSTACWLFKAGVVVTAPAPARGLPRRCHPTLFLPKKTHCHSGTEQHSLSWLETTQVKAVSNGAESGVRSIGQEPFGPSYFLTSAIVFYHQWLFLQVSGGSRSSPRKPPQHLLLRCHHEEMRRVSGKKECGV